MDLHDRPTISLPSDAQIRLVLTTLVGLAFAIYLGVKVGQGNFKWVAGLAVVASVIVLMSLLGHRGWLIVPFGMMLDVPVPIAFGRDFSAKEFTAMLVIAVAAIRFALRRQKIAVFRKEHLWVLLYVAWAALVFVKNPSGLLVLGSNLVGARYYYDILLALGLFLVMASVRIEEWDVKWFFGAILLAQILSVLYAWRTAQGSVLSPAEEYATFGSFASDRFYTWHQTIGIPATFVLMVLLSHRSLKSLMSFRDCKWWPLIALGVAVNFLSGKRMGLAMLCLLPLFSAWVRREFARGTFLAVVVLGLAGALAIGQGRLFSLSLTMQRGLSLLPGKWDAAANLGASDEYRRLLREDALEQIKESPWIGPGFAYDPWGVYMDTVMTKSTKIVTGTRAGGSWHTTWLGISADFGIPAALIWGLLLFQFTRITFRTSRALPEGDWRKTLATYLFLSLCVEWATSYTGGHTALGPFHRWWLWAMIFPLARQAKEMHDKKQGVYEPSLNVDSRRAS